MEHLTNFDFTAEIDQEPLDFFSILKVIYHTNKASVNAVFTHRPIGKLGRYAVGSFCPNNVTAYCLHAEEHKY